LILYLMQSNAERNILYPAYCSQRIISTLIYICYRHAVVIRRALVRAQTSAKAAHNSKHNKLIKNSFIQSLFMELGAKFLQLPLSRNDKNSG